MWAKVKSIFENLYSIYTLRYNWIFLYWSMAKACFKLQSEQKNSIDENFFVKYFSAIKNSKNDNHVH